MTVDESMEDNAMDVDTLSYAMVDNEDETGITANLDWYDYQHREYCRVRL